jgi:hypothetical protein
VYEDHSLILVRPDLHVVWRSRGEVPSADALAALAVLATGNGGTAEKGTPPTASVLESVS